MALIFPALPAAASARVQWSTSREYLGLGAASLLTSARPGAPASSRASRAVVCMGNVNEGKGLFAPVVLGAKSAIGPKRFNQFRGKAIAVHSQVITGFCNCTGADSAARQGLIRLAKKNGERLGFLA